MKIHEEGRHDEEEKVRHGVDELSNVGREGVVLLTPVNGAGPWVEVAPHARSMITVHSLSTILENILCPTYDLQVHCDSCFINQASSKLTRN